jgi:hypothetical protein
MKGGRGFRGRAELTCQFQFGLSRDSRGGRVRDRLARRASDYQAVAGDEGVLSAQTEEGRLRPAAAPVLGQQPSIFQKTQRETRAPGILNMPADRLTTREKGGQLGLV